MGCGEFAVCLLRYFKQLCGSLVSRRLKLGRVYSVCSLESLGHVYCREVLGYVIARLVAFVSVVGGVAYIGGVICVILRAA